MRAVVALAFLAAPALAAPPPGMTADQFIMERNQNLVDRTDGAGGECPAVRRIVCTGPKTVATKVKGFQGEAYACAFEQRVGGAWRPVKGMVTRWPGGNWDFDDAALKGCKRYDQ